MNDKPKINILMSETLDKKTKTFIQFFHLGSLRQIFTIHRTAGEGKGYLFNSSLPLPLALQT